MALQQHCATRGMVLPVYTSRKHEDGRFVYTVRVGAVRYCGSPMKDEKMAKENAAGVALMNLPKKNTLQNRREQNNFATGMSNQMTRHRRSRYGGERRNDAKAAEEEIDLRKRRDAVMRGSMGLVAGGGGRDHQERGAMASYLKMNEHRQKTQWNPLNKPEKAVALSKRNLDPRLMKIMRNGNGEDTKEKISRCQTAPALSRQKSSGPSMGRNVAGLITGRPNSGGSAKSCGPSTGFRTVAAAGSMRRNESAMSTFAADVRRREEMTRRSNTFTGLDRHMIGRQSSASSLYKNSFAPLSASKPKTTFGLGGTSSSLHKNQSPFSSTQSSSKTSKSPFTTRGSVTSRNQGLNSRMGLNQRPGASRSGNVKFASMSGAFGKRR